MAIGTKHEIGSWNDFDSLIRHCLARGLCRFEIECGTINGHAADIFYSKHFNTVCVDEWPIGVRCWMRSARRFAHEPIEAMFVQPNDLNETCFIGVRSPTQNMFLFHAITPTDVKIQKQRKRKKKCDGCHLLVKMMNLIYTNWTQIDFKYLTRRTHHQWLFFLSQSN